MLTVAQAEAKLKAAEKRVFAAHRLSTIAGYERQATNPIYPGQEAVCKSNAQIWRALYNKEMAEAELIEAKAAEEK